MSPNRKMLELAAKAAGIASDGLGWCYDIQRNCAWNPLANDGDALRLAVKLNLAVGVAPIEENVTAFSDNGVQVWEKFEGDKCAATRRAIVRVAAEIGRAIP